MKTVRVITKSLKLQLGDRDAYLHLEDFEGKVIYEGAENYVVALEDLDLFVDMGLLKSNEVIASKENFVDVDECEDDFETTVEEFFNSLLRDNDKEEDKEEPVETDDIVHTTFGRHKVINSGQHHEFPTGAIRSSNKGKIRLDVISPYALEALGECFGDNASEYGEGNYLLGIPPMKAIESLLRHLNVVQQGFIEGNQDKIAEYKNIMTNAIMLGHSMKLIEKGLYLEKF